MYLRLCMHLCISNASPASPSHSSHTYIRSVQNYVCMYVCMYVVRVCVPLSLLLFVAFIFTHIPPHPPPLKSHQFLVSLVPQSPAMHSIHLYIHRHTMIKSMYQQPQPTYLPTYRIILGGIVPILTNIPPVGDRSADTGNCRHDQEGR